MEFNTPLAVRILAHIEDLRESDRKEHTHNQRNWGVAVVEEAKLERIYNKETKELIGLGSCNTAMCFGGMACTMEGIDLEWEVIDERYEVAEGLAEGMKMLSASETTMGVQIADAAAELLGIRTPKKCESVDQDTCDQDFWENYEAGHRVVNCDCDDYDPSWNYMEEMPALFDGFNTLDQVYGYVAGYAEIEVDELRGLVEDEREKYVINIDAYESAAEIVEVS